MGSLQSTAAQIEVIYLDERLTQPNAPDCGLRVGAAMSTNLAIFLAKLGVFTFTGSKCVAAKYYKFYC